MNAQHIPGPWSKGRSTGVGQVYNAKGQMICDVITTVDDLNLIAVAPNLLDIAQRLALATADGDDVAQSTHYVDRSGVIRCKGSFLELIENARSAIAKTGGAA